MPETTHDTFLTRGFVKNVFRNAFAIVLPIVTVFFFVFSILEDSGYFARMSIMLNRAFRTMGLNGKAVLPMILGLGCVTMATMTTRILGSERERRIATALMAFASVIAAMGVITEGAKGTELKDAYRRISEQRGVNVIRADTQTARSLEFNADRIEEMLELAEELDVDAFHIFMLVPTGRGSDMLDKELPPEDYERVLAWAYEAQKTSDIHFKPTDAPHYYRIIRQKAKAEGKKVTREEYGLDAMTRGCLGGITFCFISHVGDIQPCGYFDMQLGNVKEQPFSRIWTESKVFNDLRDYSLLKGKCGACEYKAVCGGCRARALEVEGAERRRVEAALTARGRRFVPQTHIAEIAQRHGGELALPLLDQLAAIRANDSVPDAGPMLTVDYYLSVAGNFPSLGQLE